MRNIKHKELKKLCYHFLFAVKLVSSMYFLTLLSMSSLIVMGIECFPLCSSYCIKLSTVTLSIPFSLMISLHWDLSAYFHPEEISFFLRYYYNLSISPDSIIFFSISLRFSIIYPGTLTFYSVDIVFVFVKEVILKESKWLFQEFSL